MTHDPMCNEYGYADNVCVCDLIARVRADERERRLAGERVDGEYERLHETEAWSWASPEQQTVITGWTRTLTRAARGAAGGES